MHHEALDESYQSHNVDTAHRGYIFWPGCFSTRQRQGVSHSTDIGDTLRITIALQLLIDKAYVKCRIVNDQIGPSDELDKTPPSPRKISACPPGIRW